MVVTRSGMDTLVISGTREKVPTQSGPSYPFVSLVSSRSGSHPVETLVKSMMDMVLQPETQRLETEARRETQRLESYESGKISTKELFSRLWKDVYEERLTMSRTCKGDGMEPTIHSGEKVLVRKIPFPSTRSLFVGDVVLLKDPSNADLERMSRIAAMEGEEMVSTSESDMPFEIEKGACWVLLDNDSARAKGEADSRNFGPLSLGNILGRVLYAYQSISDHGLVSNSKDAVQEDMPVLMSELDLNELDKAE
ncbi:hypothetical protein L7F22_028268 [Adiantum nelumboides]|nr:hypothetical protein [Adiantum nelumboides]